MTDQIQIPESILQICREMAAVAVKYDLHAFRGTISPGFENRDWRGEVSFAWEQGRHGDDSNQLKLTANCFIHTTIKGKSATPNS